MRIDTSPPWPEAIRSSFGASYIKMHDPVMLAFGGRQFDHFPQSSSRLPVAGSGKIEELLHRQGGPDRAHDPSSYPTCTGMPD
jgi:hypothetical protein